MQGVHEVLLAGHELLIECVGLWDGIAAGLGISGDEVAGDLGEAERFATLLKKPDGSLHGRSDRRALLAGNTDDRRAQDICEELAGDVAGDTMA